MYFRSIAAVVFLACHSAAIGQTIFVDEDFESYASTSSMQAAWAPLSGDGFTAPPNSGGDLVLAGTGVDGQQGNAVIGGAGSINEEVGGWDFANNPEGYLIVPTETESIVMRGDIFIDADTGTTHRQTLGIRSDQFDRDPSDAVATGLNLVELGTWNGSVCLPTAPECNPGDPDGTPPVEPDPEYRVENDFAFRLAIFDFTTLGNYFENGVDMGPMEVEPNWQYFQFNPDLDLESTVFPNEATGNGDGVVNLGDIGSGWHTFEAVVGVDSVELTVDLFRDGIDNATGQPGVDSTVFVEIGLAANENVEPFNFDPSPINSFRFGSPSGVSSESGVASFDNLYLALEEPSDEVLVGDYNSDGVVDAADYTVYRNTLGNSVDPDGSGADGNGNGVVDPGDYDVWAANYGASAAPATAAVPEPIALALMGLVIFGAATRRI